ncbi:MAG: hypothetical protein K2Q22_04140 [Cytophagales bacterium]|nr:hypothetical protein [Cytophagales bacterium]
MILPSFLLLNHRNRVLWFLGVMVYVLNACQASHIQGPTKKHNPGIVELVFYLQVGGKPYHPDSIYLSPNGKPYQLSKVQFFLSHLALANAVGKEMVPLETTNSGIYFLELSTSCSSISFPVSNGQYSDLRFDIGLPREINHGDPSLAKYPLGLGNSEMFWEWNSGYIFFLAEGRSPVLPGGRFHFAIGGDPQIMPVCLGNLFDLVPLIKVEPNKRTRVELFLDFDQVLRNADGTHYPIDSKGAFMVHQGSRAELLRSNILHSIKFRSSSVLE